MTERRFNVSLNGDRRWDVTLTPTDATLRGRVFGPDGKPLAGVTVAIVSGAPAGKSAVTDSNGEYAITGIYGTFVARASKSGYATEERMMTTGPYLAGSFGLRSSS